MALQKRSWNKGIILPAATPRLLLAYQHHPLAGKLFLSLYGPAEDTPPLFLEK